MSDAPNDPTDPPSPPRKRLGRKLLVAAVGVATVSYVACSQNTTSGNLVAPPADAMTDVAPDVGPDAISGNLIAPPPDAAPDASVDASLDAPRDGG